MIRMAGRCRAAANLALALLAVAVTAGSCTDNTTSAGGSDGARVLNVDSSVKGCEVDPLDAPSGNLTFTVRNTGNQVTEFYLYEADGSTIVGEVENIGPGLSRDMVVRVAPGDYVTACKPGMSGDGIRGALTVTGAQSGTAPSAAEMDELASAGVEQYREFVTQQADALLLGTQAFAEAYQSGQDQQAAALVAPTRAALQSISPVAAQVMDLDPIDGARPASDSNAEWAGWRRIEADLWGDDPATTLEPDERQQAADQLVEATEQLVDALEEIDLDVEEIARVAVELAEDIEDTKLRAESDVLADTRLYGVQADLDGSRTAYLAVRPIAAVDDGDLVESLDDAFSALQDDMDTLATDGGFVDYSSLDGDRRESLAADAAALVGSLSALVGVVSS